MFSAKHIAGLVLAVPPHRKILRLVALLALTLPVPALADNVLVFAAASTGDALDEIAALFERQSGHDVTLSYAGSSVLARQIQNGAPADVFLSANAAWMDVLEGDGLIAEGSRSDLLGNALVLIAHDPAAVPVDLGPAGNLVARLGDGYLAMALVDAVPAGIYGKAALDSLGLWQSVSGQVAQTDNVRAALALVSRGEARFGVVYRSDAVADPSVTLAATFPAASHPPITYPVAAIAGRDTPAVEAFLTFLTSDTARAVFEAQGFTVPGR
jgi:molybdate transport system substrate-binding protein